MICRGKRTDNKTWVIGNHIYDVRSEQHFIMPFNNSIMFYEVIPETVGQCVGEWIGNGKDVFVGDLVKHHFGDDIGVVKFGEYRNPFNDDLHTKHIGFYVDWISGECKNSLRKDLGYWINIEKNTITRSLSVIYTIIQNY